ncbi:hypothetical protein CPHO_12135 [Corynebacterium phocae]|uniref:PucR C-terminal helix-turn-helix domain-containing protein n=1 Tax=Corynebacterium phocae TaxID=161895 RepID=A0A1L7D5Y3_9CORY|nr:PucR family transcriptional regulator [Corynebacterium phocae]APT93515.1 hypothetical protein CPHO_12135 [Corynebacterium phocae]KAA8720596.1 PucR family transcriptional regulator [Corynebacterium phocae]
MSQVTTSRLEIIQGLVDEAAISCNRSVELATPAISVICASPQLGAIDRPRADSILNKKPPREPIPWMLEHGIMEAEGPVALPPNEEFGMLARLVYPLRKDKELYGHLWIINEPPLSPAEMDQLHPITQRLARALHNHQISAESLLNSRRQATRRLLSDLPGALEDAHQDGYLPPGSPLYVRVFSFASNAHIDGIERAATPHRNPFLLAADPKAPHRLIAIEPSPSDDATAFVTRAAHSAGTPPIATGSAHITGSIASAAERARFAADVARLTGQDTLSWEDAGAWRLLLHWPLEPATVKELCPAVTDLISNQVSDIFWTTLLAYLNNSRNTKATASQLFIHRATLHYRLERAWELLGAEFEENGWEATALHLSLKLHGALQHRQV